MHCVNNVYYAQNVRFYTIKLACFTYEVMITWDCMTICQDQVIEIGISLRCDNYIIYSHTYTIEQLHKIEGVKILQVA